MKIWEGYGSEHSANLIMIGKFKESKDAKDALVKIETIKEQVRKDSDSGILSVGVKKESYGREMLDLLGKLNIGSIGPSELEQFIYEISIKQNSNELILTTDEVDVSAFFKILVLEGAKVEIFSRHDYPENNE